MLQDGDTLIPSFIQPIVLSIHSPSTEVCFGGHGGPQRATGEASPKGEADGVCQRWPNVHTDATVPVCMPNEGVAAPLRREMKPVLRAVQGR